jgi:hypothetical protein
MHYRKRAAIVSAPLEQRKTDSLAMRSPLSRQYKIPQVIRGQRVRYKPLFDTDPLAQNNCYNTYLDIKVANVVPT